MLNITCIIPSTCSGKNLPFLKKCIQSLIVSKINEVSLVVTVVSTNPQGRTALLKSPVNSFYLVDKSLGFAQMNNIAIEESLKIYKSDYYLLINDDAWVDKNFFREFTRVFQKSKPDFLNPIIFKNNTNKVDSFGIEYFRSGYAMNSHSISTSTTLATAACLLVRSQFLIKMKRKYGYYFNPILDFYFEDIEFSIRAKGINASICKEKNVCAHHMGSYTSGDKSPFIKYLTCRNMLWVILLTWPLKTIIVFLLKIIIVHLWLVFSTFGIRLSLIYLKILYETICKYRILFSYRKKTLSVYFNDFNFNLLFSKYMFRTRKHNIPF